MRYFLGDSDNAIKIQIWCCLIMNLLMVVVYSKVKKNRKDIAFSGIVSFVWLKIGSYVDVIKFLEKKVVELLELLNREVRAERDKIQLSLW